MRVSLSFFCTNVQRRSYDLVTQFSAFIYYMHLLSHILASHDALRTTTLSAVQLYVTIFIVPSSSSLLLFSFLVVVVQQAHKAKPLTAISTTAAPGQSQAHHTLRYKHVSTNSVDVPLTHLNVLIK